MSSSPNKRDYNYRTNYTHQQARQSNRYQSISQRSPLINSPQLNEQSQEHHIKNEINIQLKSKLDIVLKHNSQLLNQNATLSEMVNSLRMELDLLSKRQEGKNIQNQSQFRRIIEDMKSQQSIHQNELQKLMNQISQLHQENLRIQTEKNKQIRQMKEIHQRQMTVHIAQIKKSSDDNKQILQIQVKKVKESLQLKEFQFQSYKTQQKCEIDQLKFENNGLKNQIEHLRKLKQIQLKQIISQHKQKLKVTMKQMEREKQIEVFKRQNQIKKMKLQINQKSVQIQQAKKEGSSQAQELYDELVSIKRDKVNLLQELQDINETAVAKIQRQKQRLMKMAQMERQNMETIFNNERQSLKEQRQKIILLCIQKTHEIKRLYEIINDQKILFDTQRVALQKLVQNLTQKLKQRELNHKEETQLLKIKMAQLHESDIKTLQSYYENQIHALVKQNKIVRELHENDRQKLHKSLQQNDQLRKNFQIQISKQKAKLQDMKVKFAAANVEFKQQITSLGTKMQLTSQTLLRQTQQKQKGAQFFQTQKKKFYLIIQEKDKQIIAIQDTMAKLKEINDQEINQLHSQINMLRDSLIAKQNDFKNYKANLQTEFQRKSLKLIEESAKINPDEQIINQNNKLRQKINQLQKQLFKKGKEIQFLMRQTKSLQGELGLRAGFIQTMQLQSSAAIQDQKTKIKILMGKNQVAMKDYYQNKLNSRQKDIEALKKQLAQKEFDLRGIIVKYNGLQKKLKQLLEAQQKLTDLQKKVVNLGLDQNLISNMGELFERYKKNEKL